MKKETKAEAKPLTRSEIIAGEIMNDPDLQARSTPAGWGKIHAAIGAAVAEGRKQQRENGAGAVRAAIAILEPLRDALAESSDEYTDASQTISDLYTILEQ